MRRGTKVSSLFLNTREEEEKKKCNVERFITGNSVTSKRGKECGVKTLCRLQELNFSQISALPLLYNAYLSAGEVLDWSLKRSGLSSYHARDVREVQVVARLRTNFI